MKCCVLASGAGSNFGALIERWKAGDLHVDFRLCISNNGSAFALQRARDNGIAALHLPPSRFPDQAAYTGAFQSTLREHGVELIVLAGYMKKIPTPVIQSYGGRIINIHPGLLPSFGGQGMYGRRVHQAVLDYGAKVTGITVHFVDEEYDHGPVILQEPVRVLDGDNAETLAQRVLEYEHAHYWRAIEAVVQNRVRIEGNRVVSNV